MTDGAAQHWDAVYTAKDPTQVSWYQPEPIVSVRLVEVAATSGHRMLDVGAGESRLADRLLDAGFEVTLLDVSRQALEDVRQRLGVRSDVHYAVADLLLWQPEETFDVWHDRAVFHFLTSPADQARYVSLAASAVRPGGAVVLGCFAPGGPEACSGLPTAQHDAASLARTFGPSFVLEHAELEDHLTPGQAVQPFTWAVLRRSPSA